MSVNLGFLFSICSLQYIYNDDSMFWDRQVLATGRTQFISYQGFQCLLFGLHHFEELSCGVTL